MDNDNKIKDAESAPKKRKPRKTVDEKSKESIVAAARHVIENKSSSSKIKTEHKGVPVPFVPDHELIHKQVSVLLENELTRISGDDAKLSFDMETEYAIARKNNIRFAWKNMWSRLLLCVMVVVAITVVLSVIVNHNNKKIPVNVKGFDNVKLTELLDDVDKIEGQIREEENKRQEYENRRSEEIQKIEDTYSAEKNRIESTYNQEKKKAEKSFSQENTRLENKKTTGWMEGRTKNKELEKNRKKYDEALAVAKKKREDAIAISRNKYKNNLAQAKNLYKTEIENCWNAISRLKEDRYRFDTNKVQLEAEYDGKLKDRDILHKREMEDQKNLFDEKFLQQRNEYESRLSDARKKLEDTIASDLERENKRVEDTVNSYDPNLLKDSRIKKIVKTAGSTEYTVGTEEKKSYLPKEGASEIFKKTLYAQKEYYEDLAYLASVYGQFPQKENRAIVTYAKAMKSLASKAGNEMFIVSVNEVNRIIEEKNTIEFEKKKVSDEKNAIQNDFNKILEVMCNENIGELTAGGVVTSVSEKVYNAYVGQGRRSMFTAEENKGKIFPCYLYHGEKKVAVGRVELKENGKYVLSNIALNGNSIIYVGDRIVFEEPYMP